MSSSEPAPESVAAAVTFLEQHGYTSDLRLDGAGVHCNACGITHEPSRVAVTHTYRFEGTTDPDDEAIVLGVVCGQCGARGVIVSPYGREADPAVFETLARLSRG